MTDLERRAQLGDREAQEECTRQGIVLPCPFCGGNGKYHKIKSDPLDLGFETIGYCVCCGKCIAGTQYESTKNLALSEWNIRQSPPLVRCRECRYWDRLDEFSDGYCENPMGIDDVTQPGDFCSYGERKENRP